MSQYTWTNPGQYGQRRNEPLSWVSAPNPNLFGGGVEPFYQLDWPNPPPGYPYPTALRTTIAQHPPWTVWNPNDKSANVTLTNGNLSASAATTAGVVRATASVSAGKWFFSFQASSIPFTNAVRIGIANGSASLSVELGNAANTTALGYRPDGIVAFNGGIAATLATWTTADTIDVALDEGNQKIWFRVSGAGWNNDVIASQDPANNIGGISIATTAGPHFPASSYRNAAAGAANFGASVFTYSVPAGYIGFDGTASLNTPAVPTPAFQPTVFVPQRYAHPLALRTHIDATRLQLIGQDTIYGEPGQGVPNYDWPVPRGYSFPSGLRTQTPSLNPNLSGSGIAPFAQTDWPNPRGYVPASTLRTHTDATRLQLIGQDTIYGAPGEGVPNYDWPVPKGPRAAIDLRSWAQNLLQSTLAPLPPPPFQPAGPVPRGYVFPVSLRTHLDQVRIQLIGQDRIYGAPGQGVPNYDWPVPKGYRYPTSLRTWTQDLLQSTIAPIIIDPRKQTDWPNPRGYPYPVSLRSLVNPTITMRNAVTWTPIDDPATPTWTTIADPATPQWTEVPEN